MAKVDIARFKELLEKEEAHLVKELANVAEKNPDDPTGRDWEPTPAPNNEQESDPADVADQIEELGERVAIGNTLEARLVNVREALKAIEDGNYGKCLVGGEPHEIPLGRLEANPAATTCIDHA